MVCWRPLCVVALALLGQASAAGVGGTPVRPAKSRRPSLLQLRGGQAASVTSTDVEAGPEVVKDDPAHAVDVATYLARVGVTVEEGLAAERVG